MQNEDKLTAVCPLLHKDFDLLLILMSSLNRFFEADSLLSIIVVVRESELEEIDTGVKDLSSEHRLEVISEESLDLQTRLDAGWFRLQLIKLRVASRVATSFYLTLDADNICCKPVSYAQLVPDGRALMSTTAKGVHPSWWRNSAKILGVRPQIRKLSPRIWKPRITTPRAGMSVTPALLSTRHVLELTNFIEDRWKSPLGEVLSDHTFTEYSLYYLFMEMRGLVDSVHCTDHPIICQGAGANVWSADQFEA